MKPIRSLIDSKEKLLKLLLAIVMIALLIYMPSTRNRRVLNIAIVVFMYIALGESWNVLSGLTGIFSIAHCIFYGIGMYALLICAKKFHLPLYVGFGIGLMLNIAFGALVGRIVSHLSGLYFSMSLLGLQQVLISLSSQWVSLTNGDQGLSMPKKYLMTKVELYWLALAMALFMMLLFVIIRKSKIGTCFLAVKENPNLTNALGINVGAWRIVASIISACMASVVGAFYCLYMMSGAPTIFSGTIALKIIMVTMVGGSGNVWGPVLGSGMIILDELVRGAMPNKFAPISVIVYAIVLIVVVIFRPAGLASLFQGFTKKTEKRAG